MRSKIKIVEQEQGLEASDCVYKHNVKHLKKRILTTKQSEKSFRNFPFQIF
jgi:hypothetical protein